jgi:hypothetical protein
LTRTAGGRACAFESRQSESGENRRNKPNLFTLQPLFVLGHVPEALNVILPSPIVGGGHSRPMQVNAARLRPLTPSSSTRTAADPACPSKAAKTEAVRTGDGRSQVDVAIVGRRFWTSDPSKPLSVPIAHDEGIDRNVATYNRGRRVQLATQVIRGT